MCGFHTGRGSILVEYSAFKKVDVSSHLRNNVRMEHLVRRLKESPAEFHAPTRLG